MWLTAARTLERLGELGAAAGVTLKAFDVAEVSAPEVAVSV